jgi:hypothetical protein
VTREKILQRRVSRQPEILNTDFLCVECPRPRDESNGDGVDSLQCVGVAPWGSGGETGGCVSEMAKG